MYIDFLILLIPTPLVSEKCFSFLFRYFFVIYVMIFSRSINTYGQLRASHGSHMKGCT